MSHRSLDPCPAGPAPATHRRALSRWIALCAAALLLALLVAPPGCARPLKRYETSYLDVFDTVTQLVLYAPDDATAQAWQARMHDELIRYHQLFDIYHDYPSINNLKTVNDAAGQAPVAVDASILELVSSALTLSARTDGKMNIALGAVLTLWHDCRTAAQADPSRATLPNDTALLAAAAHTDLSDVVVDSAAGTLYLADSGLRLDVGAIAKGYAAEQLARLAQQLGVRAALINLGGNVRALGTRSDGTPWQVAVQSPDGGAPLHTLALTDKSLVTSGDYQRYFTLDGKRYHHIIDPDTRMPSDYFSSVTVLCPDATQADALSTALFCMPLQEGLALIQSFPGTEALWITPDGTQTMSAGFDEYLTD